MSTWGRAVAAASSRALTFGLGGSANEVQVGDVQPERLPDSPDPASRTTSAPVPRLGGIGPAVTCSTVGSATSGLSSRGSRTRWPSEAARIRSLNGCGGHPLCHLVGRLDLDRGDPTYIPFVERHRAFSTYPAGAPEMQGQGQRRTWTKGIDVTRYRCNPRGIALRSVACLLVFLTGSCAGTGAVSGSNVATPAQRSTSAVTESPSAPTSASVSRPPTTAPPKLAVKAGPVPARPAGGITVNGAGAVLPNSARTPGAVNPAVSQANIGRTICVSGWTATVRPNSSVTTGLKVEQLASGYAYEGDTTTGDYEEDHLISLEIGGAPDAEANLWPEPYNTSEGARVKDVIENKLHSLVCEGTISLATAQRAIATNWWVAYQTYVGATPAKSTSNPPSVAQPAPAPRPAPGGGATALCHDGTYSYAAHHQGACSGHGGVKVFYK